MFCAQFFGGSIIIVHKMLERSPVNFSSTRRPTSDSGKTGRSTVTNCYRECTTTHHFDIKIQIKFWRRGHSPLFRPHLSGEAVSPSPQPTLLGADSRAFGPVPPRQTEILVTPLRAAWETGRRLLHAARHASADVR